MEQPSDPTQPAPGASRAQLLALLRWLLFVAVAFGLLAAGLHQMSKSALTASPMPGSLPAAENGVGPQEGQHTFPAPDFRFASLDGQAIGPRDYSGEVVLVELWATWCGPCRLQAKYLEQLHEELEGQGVRFLAISVGEDEATVREYVERKPFPYPVLLDPEDSLGQRYQIIGLPTVMIVDRQGAVSFLETGVSDAKRLRQALRAAGADLA